MFFSRLTLIENHTETQLCFLWNHVACESMVQLWHRGTYSNFIPVILVELQQLFICLHTALGVLYTGCGRKYMQFQNPSLSSDPLFQTSKLFSGFLLFNSTEHVLPSNYWPLIFLNLTFFSEYESSRFEIHSQCKK